ncbi:unnamed protein product (macronuclear) [Paramecium tetraurelia]|uniref:Transmembrane protein n=1 Tax=Paramecium tetraurelia TaxID=5888 RepID=A0BSN8_PARTE|nr:uncharacterized protein GSPATT00031787001 [Paramecium tetraurelia]CAK61555.1 unnamed protein product [Paramecium tetraurelia]|eukprot:XP_001428953.1 hypothetical protein (macronuclear) [Paramecium tetraurelia strain d4-2]
MLSLPFDKWSLKFFDPEFESQYEDHLNKIRLISFRILNLTISIAAFICLLTFVIQQQSQLLSILVSFVSGGCVFLLMISRRILPYLKMVFSFYYVWAVTTNILIAFAGFSIPNFIFGFNTCALAIGTMQYSDNRLKVAYTIITPFVLLGVFDVYKADNLAFVFQTVSCTTFIGIWGYMNEYTSRLAFSLNLISNKQKDLINEFVNDAMFALSLDERSRQFILEFQNNRFVELMNIKETEQIKGFLRSTFVMMKSNESQTKLRDKSSTKLINLEEVFFQRIQSFQMFSNSRDQQNGNLEIYQHDLIKNETKKMCLQIRFLNFGKPIIFALIKSEQVPNLINKYESQIKEYQQLIINMSSKIIKKQSLLYEEMKRVKLENSFEQQKLIQIECLNLSIINYIRNFMLFFQKNKIVGMKSILQPFKFENYIATINQYFQAISAHYSIKFKLQNYIERNCLFNINIKYLTQILINIFDELIKNLNENSMISLRIIEEFQLNRNEKKQKTQGFQNTQINDGSTTKQFKLVQFTFIFSSNEYINLNNLTFQKNFTYNDQKSHIFEDGSIISEITCLLLDNIGPNNNIQLNQYQTPQMSTYQNTISFFIFSDQSQLEPSYLKVREKPLLI